MNCKSLLSYVFSDYVRLPDTAALDLIYCRQISCFYRPQIQHRTDLRCIVNESVSSRYTALQRDKN